MRCLNAAQPLPFRRMECAAGTEAQIDFVTGAPLLSADGKRRKSHVLRIVLSQSRKGYSEWYRGRRQNMDEESMTRPMQTA